MTEALAVSDAELDRAIVAEIRGAVAATWRAGRLLTERKRRMEHGEWLPYLAGIGLPARTAQKAMDIFRKYADPAHLPGTIERALEASPVERRRADVLRYWPGLASDDPDIRTVLDHYVRITTPILEGGGEWPSTDEIAWAMGCEGLFEREFKGATA